MNSLTINRTNRGRAIATRRLTRDGGARRRSGIAILEMLTAVLLLSIAAVGYSRFVVSMNSGLKNLELSSRLSWEIANAREKIRGWSDEKLTEQEIEQLPISEYLTEEIEQLRWQVTIQTVAKPTPTKEIDLQLVGVYQGQRSELQRLVFWVSADRETEPAMDVEADNSGDGGEDAERGTP